MKKGLVLEGGGSRTYFTCGVLDCFLEEGIYADYVIGTSAGIANGVSYVSRQKGRNLEIAERFLNDKRYMGVKHLLNPKNKSYYNIRFVYEEIPNKHIPFDYEEFAGFEGDVISVVTNVKSGKAEYLKMLRDDRSFVHLVASCALPILFPLIEIDGKKYMDGGICDPIAVEEALRNGCDKVIVVLTREKGYVKEEEKALKLSARLYGKYPEFAKALLERTKVYNETLKRVWDLEKEGRIFVIAPEDVSGCKRTERNLDVVKGLYNQGMEVARKVMPNLMEYLNLHS